MILIASRRPLDQLNSLGLNLTMPDGETACDSFTNFPNRTSRCHYVALCLFPMLTACASQPVEWIDVPLADHVYFAIRPAYRAEQVEIPVPANSDLEYMLAMKRGYSVSYEWRSTDISDPELLLAEFHGHTVRDSEEAGSVMFFKQGRAETSRGYLVAPFDGIHGWYFSNESDSDITITLSLSGFYTIPDSE